MRRSEEKSNLTALLERVKAATGADPELDGRIWCAANGYEFVRVEPWSTGYRVGYNGGAQGWYYTHPTEPLTASLDAALALAERVLGRDRAETLAQEAFGSTRYVNPLSAAFALSLLAALLSALIAGDHKAAEAVRAAQVAGDGSRDDPSLPNPLISEGQ